MDGSIDGCMHESLRGASSISCQMISRGHGDSDRQHNAEGKTIMNDEGASTAMGVRTRQQDAMGVNTRRHAMLMAEARLRFFWSPLLSSARELLSGRKAPCHYYQQHYGRRASQHRRERRKIISENTDAPTPSVHMHARLAELQCPPRVGQHRTQSTTMASC